MRPGPGVVLAAALAACSVDLEGAACASDGDCPSGQACGFDRTCSEAAKACPAGACRVGEDACAADGRLVACERMPGTACGELRTSDCPGGRICLSGGACQPSYQVAITSPAPGAVVGPAGVDVQVSVSWQTALVAAPSAVELRGPGGATSLACTLTVTRVSTCAGHFTPPAAPEIDGPVDLVVAATPGSPEENASPPVSIALDTKGPVVSVPAFSCDTCLRDGVVTVAPFDVQDTHPGPAPTAVLDLGGGTTIPITLTGPAPTWQGTLDLKGAAFPAFAPGAVVRVQASDALGNSRSAASASRTITRLRWAIPVEAAGAPALTGAAVEGGKLYLGADNGAVYAVDPAAAPASVARWQVTAAGGKIPAAPAVGQAALWVGGDDRKVYALAKADGQVLNAATPCLTRGPVLRTPAILPPGMDPETAFVGSNDTAAAIYAARVSGCTASSAYSGAAFGGSPAIDGSANVYAVIGMTLRSYTFQTAGGWTENWPSPPSVGAGTAPLALDATPLVWTAAASGSIVKTTAAGTPTAVATVGASPTGAVVDGSGNVLVGDGASLHKLSPAGTELWASPVSLGAAARGALLLSGGTAAVSTAGGKLLAVDASGAVVWQGQVAGPGVALSEPNLVRLAGDDLRFSTVVLGGADGVVYGVIADGSLAATAWPMAHHDPRNTGNAATPLP